MPAKVKAQMKVYDKSKADALKGRVAKKEQPVVNKVKEKVADKSTVKGSVKEAPTRTSPAKYGEGNEQLRKDKANVSEAQLKKSGMSLRAYMNAWNKSGKRPA